MSDNLATSLTLLEQLGDDLAAGFKTTLPGSLDLSCILEQLLERREALARLTAILETERPSELEARRLIAIHKQGEQIQANLKAIRSQCSETLAINEGQRAFMHLLKSVLNEPSAPSHVNSTW